MKKKIFVITFVLLGFFVQQSLKAQRYNPFGEIRKSDKNSTLNMHLLPEGEFAVGKDKFGEIVRVNMLKIKDWSKVPGVKKAWIMKGFEGQESMAFHPIISEVKDVDGDGKPDIFRCRSEHQDARIERLRYDNGDVVWESEPMAALHGDESRLPVFDLDGDGVQSVLHATKGGTWCINAKTGKTEWSVKEALGDIIVGHFLDKKKQAVVVRSDGILRCYDDKGNFLGVRGLGEYKPFVIQDFAANALKWGVAGLWIDGGRIEMEKEDFEAYKAKMDSFSGTVGNRIYGGNSLLPSSTKRKNKVETKGRWPANLILSYSEDEYELRHNITKKQKAELFSRD